MSLAAGAAVSDEDGIRNAASVIDRKRPRQETSLAASPGLQRESRNLGQGRTLAAVLSDLGLEPQARTRALEALGKRLDLRRLRPQTGLVALKTGDGAIERLAVRAEVGRFVRLDLRSDMHAEVVEIPVVVAVETAGGTIESSVSQALEDTPNGFQLTLAFADIFQWDVDLLVDPRQGDQVRMVYEVHRIGTPPADLPAFGRAPEQSGQFLRVGRILAATYEGRIASSAAYWVEGDDGSGRYYDATGQALQKTFLKSPLNYRRISSGFSNRRRNPVTRKVVPHHGVDFAAATGTPVVAAADGRVSFTGWSGPLGRAIRIRHGSEYETVYGHLSRVAKGVGPGTEVRQNEVIGYVGASGRATGPHLHYTMIERGRPIDPLRFRNPSTAPLADELRPRLDAAKLTWSPLLGSIPLATRMAEAGTSARRGV